MSKSDRNPVPPAEPVAPAGTTAPSPEPPAASPSPPLAPLDRDPAPTRIIRPPASRQLRTDASPVTRRVRAKSDSKAHEFHQDPVVGWLVVVAGPGLGAFRPVFEGNNSVGRATTQRIPLDFGDDGISAEEQAFIRYDAADRAFLLVPNMSKTNRRV